MMYSPMKKPNHDAGIVEIYAIYARLWVQSKAQQMKDYLKTEARLVTLISVITVPIYLFVLITFLRHWGVI
ncbi:hypothetical protein [Larkinella soli]|uniref:hypothetical protein n=1 Tax=Larkinella soli TaxID=1770527 RepID=UPI000FFC695E|nr:hypothetical protein [Larkinella soli]